MGYYQRCTTVAHVAPPPTIVLGPLDVVKDRGAQLRVEHGPWGGRSLAAQNYNLANRYLPGAWVWAAMSRGMDVSSPLLVVGHSRSHADDGHIRGGP